MRHLRTLTWPLPQWDCAHGVMRGGLPPMELLAFDGGFSEVHTSIVPPVWGTCGPLLWLEDSGALRASCCAHQGTVWLAGREESVLWLADSWEAPSVASHSQTSSGLCGGLGIPVRGGATLLLETVGRGERGDQGAVRSTRSPHRLAEITGEKAKHPPSPTAPENPNSSRVFGGQMGSLLSHPSGCAK